MPQLSDRSVKRTIEVCAIFVLLALILSHFFGSNGPPQPGLPEIPLAIYQNQGLIPAQHLAGQVLPIVPLTLTPASETRDVGEPESYRIDLRETQKVVNKRIVIENHGDSNIVNPWVVVNGRRDWFDVSSMLAEALGSERDAGKRAFRIWRFIADHRYHWYPAEDGMEIHDPIKLMNVYGYGFCDDSASSAEALFTRAGFPGARCWWITGHVIPEVKYGGAWHMLDPDLQVFYPGKNNRGVAGVDECQRMDWLVDRVSGPEIAAIYGARRTARVAQGEWETKHTMAMTLRPGESLERCWYHWDKYHDNFQHQRPPVFGNGRLTWEPALDSELFKSGLESFTNLAPADTDPATPPLHPASTSHPAEVVLEMESPYLFVGGRLELGCVVPEEGDTIGIEFSKDGKNWVALGAIRGPAPRRREVELDALIAPQQSPACYRFLIRLTIRGSRPEVVGIERIKVTGEIQCAPAALPALEPGKVNDVAVRLAAAAGGALRVRQDFEYQTRSGAPLNLAAAISPQPEARLKSAIPTFTWTLADPEATGCEIMVSYDAEGTMPVSPALHRRLGGERTWTPTGLWLRPNQAYYWRVRGVDVNGEAGPWSPAWRFTIEGDGLLTRLFRKRT